MLIPNLIQAPVLTASRHVSDHRQSLPTTVSKKTILNADASVTRINRTPLRRWGEPEEIAAGILFLCSDDASFITGTELVIDGGVTATLS